MYGFSTKVSLHIFGEEFLCPTAAYDLPLATGTDLKCPSLSACRHLLHTSDETLLQCFRLLGREVFCPLCGCY